MYNIVYVTWLIVYVTWLIVYVTWLLSLIVNRVKSSKIRECLLKNVRTLVIQVRLGPNVYRVYKGCVIIARVNTIINS